ncbi:MAG: ribokinase [Chloroflexi bacterium]|nr:ribokinase [Chloroflexota bacterium]
MSIVVVGGANQDLLVHVERFPVPGETVVGSEYLQAPGGKGANQAVAVARLGTPVGLIARVGADVFGDVLIEGWRREGIDTRWVQRDTRVPTGVAFILIQPDAENEIVVALGANGRLSAADVEAAEEAIAGAAVLACQLEVPLDTVQRAVGLAHAHGASVLLNPAPARELPESLLRQVDVLTPNATEAARLVGRPIVTVDDARAAGEELLKRGVGSAVITLGRRGAVLIQPDRQEHVAAIPVDAVDPTGAGDAFNGALAVFLAEGRSLVEATRLASAAAALATTRVGAQTALPTRDEVLGLVRRSS